MKIRSANLKDAKEISKIIGRNLGKDYKPFRITKELVEEEMRDNSKFFVAVFDNKIIGSVRYSIVDLDLAELRWLVVDKPHRNNGVGTNLTKRALNSLKRKNIRKVVARTQSNNKFSIRILLELGFYIEGYFREHYRKGTDILQFAKFL